VRGYLSDDLGFLGALHPRIPERMPRPRDEGSSGLALYKGGFALGEDLSNLTLPRFFIGRSRLRVMPLTAGLAATAEIKTGRRRIIEFLPLQRRVEEAGRER
jgi:hypothetical protein